MATLSTYIEPKISAAVFTRIEGLTSVNMFFEIFTYPNVTRCHIISRADRNSAAASIAFSDGNIPVPLPIIHFAHPLSA